MASKRQSVLKEKKLIPAKCVRPHLVRSNALTVARRSCGRTHAQPTLTVIYVQTQGNYCRTHTQSALAAIAVICGRTCTLRSTTNNWCVRTQVVRSNAGSAFERSPMTRQPINRPRCIICFSRLGGASRAQNPLFSTINPS
jgi:hypothetical protein